MLSINKTKSYIKMVFMSLFMQTNIGLYIKKQDKLREQFLKISLKFYVVYSWNISWGDVKFIDTLQV